jgi:hypothetical protein
MKEDQRTGKLTEGIVKDILTKSPMHPHGIKVRLVRRTPMEKQVKLGMLRKFWNKFLVGLNNIKNFFGKIILLFFSKFFKKYFTVFYEFWVFRFWKVFHIYKVI